jgi:mercuric ion binding protein
MRKLTLIVLGITALSAPSAFAAERTVTLAVQNMYCAACPHTVRASLQAVRGVQHVTVSLKEHSAIVTYDDSVTSLKALTAATTNAGYPSSPKS